MVRSRNVVSAVSEDELIKLSVAAAEAAAIDESEREMIESALALDDTVVREVMVPRTDMVTVGADATVVDALDVAIERGLSRLPVCDPDIDHIAGVILLKDLARVERRSSQGHMSLRSVMRRAMFVPETKRVDALLREMRTNGHHLAVVIDEYGGTAGLVTLEDLVEELVGEIVDEFDRPDPLLLTQIDGEALVHGRMPIDQFNDLTDTDLPDDDWDTVGGLIFGKLGHVPVEGDTVDIEGHKLIVERIEDRRVVLVRYKRL